MSDLVLLPDANGDQFDWFGTPIGQKYEAVLDLNGPDDDNSWLGSNLAGAVFLVGTHGIGTEHRVQSVGYVGLTARCKKVTLRGPNGTVAPLIKSGGVLYEGPPVDVDTLYADIGGAEQDGWIIESDPATGGPWTMAAALSAQVGCVDRTSGTHNLRCSTIRKIIEANFMSRVNAVRDVSR